MKQTKIYSYWEKEQLRGKGQQGPLPKRENHYKKSLPISYNQGKTIKTPIIFDSNSTKKPSAVFYRQKNLLNWSRSKKSDKNLFLSKIAKP